MTKKTNRYSATITQGPSHGAAQAMLYGTGLTEKDLAKPQVGISSVWYEGNTCNMHLMDLADRVKQGVDAAGLVGMRFNTIGVSDGISMGTDGMSYSLQSRDMIADSIETVMCAHGGTIKPGIRDGQKIDIISAFQSYGEFISGNISDEDRQDIVRKACPGAGACGGMYTANTMASAIEALGMSLPYSSSTPAVDPLKLEECFKAGEAVRKLLEMDLKPRDIMTRAAFENAMVLIITLGGSTNAVLHLIAMARAADINLTIDDFQSVSDRTPYLADLKPSGKYVMEDLHTIGGIPAVMKYLLENDLINGECITVTGKTIRENLQDLKGLSQGQDVIHSLDNPIKKSGHIRILKGNVAPGGSVAKITGKEGLVFRGPARVFDSEEDMLAALEENRIQKGDVVVIRFEGPKGGPGMPEMLTPTSAIMGAGLGNDVAMITDGRFSGGSHGFIIGHVVPEAQEGGPIALLHDGDVVTIDAEKNLINADIRDEEFARRKAEWKMPPYKVTRGTLHKYIKTVKSASEGCVTDE
jgi:dihydroxy-acid dehydratase